MDPITVVTWVLGICTVLGGVAAVMYFRERGANRPSPRQKLVKRAADLGYSEELLAVGDNALGALLDRPRLWEYRFLYFTLSEQIERRRRLKLELRYGLPLPNGPVLDDPAAVTWMHARFQAAIRMAEELRILIHEAIPDALGPSGVSGDPIKLLHTSLALGDLYQKAITWGLDFCRVSPPHNQARLFSLMPRSAHAFIDAIEETRDKLWLFIDGFDTSPPAKGERRVVELQVTLRDAIPPEVFEELDNLGRPRV